MCASVASRNAAAPSAGQAGAAAACPQLWALCEQDPASQHAGQEPDEPKGDVAAAAAEGVPWRPRLRRSPQGGGCLRESCAQMLQGACRDLPPRLEQGPPRAWAGYTSGRGPPSGPRQGLPRSGLKQSLQPRPQVLPEELAGLCVWDGQVAAHSWPRLFKLTLGAAGTQHALRLGCPSVWQHPNVSIEASGRRHRSILTGPSLAEKVPP